MSPLLLLQKFPRMQKHVQSYISSFFIFNFEYIHQTNVFIYNFEQVFLYLVGVYLPKFKKGNTRTMFEICSKLTTKIPERHH